MTSSVFSFNTLIDLIPKAIGEVKKHLVEDKAKEADESLQQIYVQLQSISKYTENITPIHIHEISVNYGELEQNIKHQYNACSTMLNQIEKDPDNANSYMDSFKETYMKQQGTLNLNEFYRGVTGKQDLFGRPLLKDFLEQSEGKRKYMEARRDHLDYIIHIGLIALMAYYVVSKYNIEDFKEEWDQKVIEIQKKMQEVLSNCNK